MAEEYFKKIATELVQNAFKFSEPGSPVRIEPEFGRRGDGIFRPRPRPRIFHGTHPAH